ncbi:MAG TPA: hypothetical protein VNH40_01200, partial [Gaiellaceae bacterium]|nr:hypothetical protein [Gaiellaceae bacterium]
LRPLAGLEADAGLGGDRRGEAFAAWRRFLEALAEQRPLVLVLEDLHWADEGLLDFVDELVDWLSGVPLLVVCSARPELLERRPTWGGGKLNASTIALSPLTQEQTALLIAYTVERSVLPAEIQQMLLERAAGNPLYAEQFAQLYLERGSVEDLPLPETLQGIIAARLDALSPEEKLLLQDAAVIGKVFWSGALLRDEQEVTGILHGLERKGFLTRQRRSSVEQEGEWAFAHMLLRDVTYNQIPRADRARRHRRTAEWIDSLSRPEDHAELLAHHWSTALELAGAAGQDTTGLVGPTRLALRVAGDRAYAVNAYPAAAAYYRDALALWPEDDEERPLLLYRHADALYLAGDEQALVALEDARDAVLAVDDRPTAAEAEIAISRIWWHQGRNDQARAHETRARELAGDVASPATARVLATIARTRLIGGEPEEGLHLATEVLAMAEALDLDELRAHTLTTIGNAKEQAGDPSGRTDLQRAFEIALAARMPQASTIANNLAVASFLRLDLAEMRPLFAEGLRIAERFGDAVGARWLRGQLTHNALWLGRWDESLRDIEAFLAESEAGSPHYLDHQAQVARAHIREARGDVEGALADTRLALAGGRAAKDPQAILPVLGLAASRLFDHGYAPEARELARELVEVARANPQESVCQLPWTFSFSPLAVEFESELRDAVEQAPPGPWKTLAFACLDRDFVRAAEIWAGAGSPTMEARLRLRAGEELIEAGRRAEGEAELAKALAFYRAVDATYFIRRAEALLERPARSG